MHPRTPPLIKMESAFTIATYNVRKYGKRTSRDGDGEMLRRVCDAMSIVCLQEAPELPTDILDEMHHIHYGELIMVFDESVVQMVHVSRPSERILVVVFSAGFTVVNAHILTSEDQQKLLEVLAGINMPVVLAGDLNPGQFPRVLDSLQEQGFVITEDADETYYRRGEPYSRLDFVMGRGFRAVLPHRFASNLNTNPLESDHKCVASTVAHFGKYVRPSRSALRATSYLRASKEMMQVARDTLCRRLSTLPVAQRIELEVWELDLAAFGAFVARIPAPLGIGERFCT